MEKEQAKTSPLTWIVFVIVFSLVFVFTYELFSGESLFESKEDERQQAIIKCQNEAFDRAAELRDSNLRILKAKTKPTAYDLAEIESLEGWQSENLVSRDDKQYLYEECMKLYK